MALKPYKLPLESPHQIAEATTQTAVIFVICAAAAGPGLFPRLLPVDVVAVVALFGFRDLGNKTRWYCCHRLFTSRRSKSIRELVQGSHSSYERESSKERERERK